MHLLAVIVFVVSIRGFMQLDYDCYFDGSIDISNPDMTKFKAFDLILGKDNTDCHGDFTDDFSHVLLENCILGERIGILFLTRKFGIIMAGNYAGPLSVKCHNLPPVEVLAEIVSKYLIVNNASVPTNLKDIINGSLIVTKMRHISETSVYSDDLSFEWVLNTTVLQHFLALYNASGTTLVPALLANYSSPTVGIIYSTTAQQSVSEIPGSRSTTQTSETNLELPSGQSTTTQPSLVDGTYSTDSNPTKSSTATSHLESTTEFLSVNEQVSPASPIMTESKTDDEMSSINLTSTKPSVSNDATNTNLANT